jgi:hypothetical protein
MDGATRMIAFRHCCARPASAAAILFDPIDQASFISNNSSVPTTIRLGASSPNTLGATGRSSSAVAGDRRTCMAAADSPGGMDIHNGAAVADNPDSTGQTPVMMLLASGRPQQLSDASFPLIQ